MKILYVPLDERPCNLKFPRLIASIRNDVELMIPGCELLPRKKKPADIDGLWSYVLDHAEQADYAVLSLDMLLYGGLLPSRIHYETEQALERRIQNLRILAGKTTVLAFQCIMRCPHYDSSEEEPDYYAQYGQALFYRAYYQNKKERLGLTEQEEKALQEISIPQEIIQDYETRRNFNLKYNLKVAELVKEGIIDTLVIPQDDSSEYGYTAIAQKQVVDYVRKNCLEQKVHIYPGADEVASSLIARVLNRHLNRTVQIYPFFSATLGPTIVPLYEDRPIMESLKYHVRIIGGELTDRIDEADFVLAYNTCGKLMQESFDQDHEDLTYTSHRNLMDFALKIRKYIQKGYPVAVCDSAFSNGSDLTLLRFLDELDIMDKIYGYAGWNTNCNSLGTVLSMACYALGHQNDALRYNLAYRYIEDGVYQANIRQNVIAQVLGPNGLSYYDFKDRQQLVEEEIRARCMNVFQQFRFNQKYGYEIDRVRMPWKRMFEVDLEISEGAEHSKGR